LLTNSARTTYVINRCPGEPAGVSGAASAVRRPRPMNVWRDRFAPALRFRCRTAGVEHRCHKATFPFLWELLMRLLRSRPGQRKYREVAFLLVKRRLSEPLQRVLQPLSEAGHFRLPRKPHPPAFAQRQPKTLSRQGRTGPSVSSKRLSSVNAYIKMSRIVTR
jgi:hypothetical protein